ARRDAPVDGTNRIARQVGPRLDVLDPRADKRRMVGPIAKAVRQTLDGQDELARRQGVYGVEVAFLHVTALLGMTNVEALMTKEARSTNDEKINESFGIWAF